MQHEKILLLIYEAIEEYNSIQEPEDRLQPIPEQVLYPKNETGLQMDDFMGLLIILDEIMDTHELLIDIPLELETILKQHPATVNILAQLLEKTIQHRQENRLQLPPS